MGAQPGGQSVYELARWGSVSFQIARDQIKKRITIEVDQFLPDAVYIRYSLAI